jgi:hypothetical protein
MQLTLLKLGVLRGFVVINQFSAFPAVHGAPEPLTAMNQRM